ERTANLTWLMLALSTAIFVLVCALMIIAIARRRGASKTAIVGLGERGRSWILWGGVLLPVGVLSLVSVVAVLVMRERPVGRNAVTILVTGHQWWWQLDYDRGSAQSRFRTANELHVPVGRPVLLRLTTNDVIHSFWVPTLAGKMDLLPGD